MNTPICDYISAYASGNGVRLHMPGHKGCGNIELFDITEISGADDLSCPSGIILQSELNATTLFGTAHTYYVTSGSSQAIKAMLLTAVQATGKRKIVATRNVHRAFLSACALVGIDVEFVGSGDGLCAVNVAPEMLESAIDADTAAVFITSPDYLGNIADIAAFSEICHAHDVLLLVDNAHGAYLKFLPTSHHPIDLGCDMCCDSAHKTLSALTGGAYLHVSTTYSFHNESTIRTNLALFGSTSPSYLILQSLDRCNAMLADGFTDRLTVTARRIAELKKLIDLSFYGDEPIKLTIDCATSGLVGTNVSQTLRASKIECEYADTDNVVMMFSYASAASDFDRTRDVLSTLKRGRARKRICVPQGGRRVKSIRDAVLGNKERIDVAQATGKICADVSTSCPPAISPVIPGEEITKELALFLQELGKTEIDVCK